MGYFGASPVKISWESVSAIRKTFCLWP